MSSSDKVEDIVVTGIALYSATLVLVVALRLWLYSYQCFRRCGLVYRALSWTAPKNLFFHFIVLFLLCRLVWFVVYRWSNDNVSDYVFNRLAFVMFFTAFTLVIFFWADALHAMRNITVHPPALGKEPESGFFNSWKTRIAFVLCNLLIYIGQLGFIIHFVVETSRQREGAQVYNVNILMVVALFGLVCLAFLVYGIGLLIVTRKAMNTRRKIKFYAQTIVITVVLVACFGARFAVFLYRPITGQFMNPWLFAMLAYNLTELVPTVLMAIVLSVSLQKKIALIGERDELLQSGARSTRSLHHDPSLLRDYTTDEYSSDISDVEQTTSGYSLSY